MIDDHCLTSDPDIYAIGEVALWDNRVFGLVAPGYQMAEAAAAHLDGDREAAFRGADMSTKLKLMGVDVASIGDAHGATPVPAARCSWTRPPGSTRRRWSANVARNCWARCWWATPPITAPCCSCASMIWICPATPPPWWPRPPARRRPWAPMPCRTRRRSARATTFPRATCAPPSTPAATVSASSRRNPRLRHLRRVRGSGQAGAGHGTGEARRGGQQPRLRTLRPFPPGALPPGAGGRHPHLRGTVGAPRQRPWLRRLQAHGGLDSGVLLERARTRPGPGRPAGHQRLLHGQHAARRHLFRGTPGTRRRDHPGQADHDR